MSINSVQEVREGDLDGPSCHVCGAIMVLEECSMDCHKQWHCKSCGATTGCTVGTEGL